MFTHLEERFGTRGKIGREGELRVIELIKSWGYEVQDFESNMEMQKKGFDIGFRKPGWARFYYADVKTNIYNDNVVIEIEKPGGHPGWFLKNKPDRYFFVAKDRDLIVQCGCDALVRFMDRCAVKYKLKPKKVKNGAKVIYVPISALQAEERVEHLCVVFGDGGKIEQTA